jgi:hypothetical protein
MKHTMISMSVLAIAACGGKPAPVQPKEPDPVPTPVVEKQPEPPPPAPEPPPPPPKSWHAKADMTPVKGVKIKAATVTFSQDEGQQVVVGSKGWFDGIRSGNYHFVIHEAADCGPNAARSTPSSSTATARSSATPWSSPTTRRASRASRSRAARSPPRSDHNPQDSKGLTGAC